MDSITSNNTNNYHQSSTGLLRFRFAPSSMLSNYFTEDEVDNMVSLEVDDKSLLRSTYSYSDLPPYYPRKLTVSAGMESNNSHGLFESAMGINQREEVKRVDSNGSSCLSRQNSSPAGFFGNLSVQNVMKHKGREILNSSQKIAGHATFKGIGDYGGLNGSIASPRLKMLSYSSRLPSSLGMLSQISEVGSESFESDSPRGGKFGDEDVDSSLLGNPGFAYGAWNNYGIADNLSGLKREQDSTQKLFPNGLIRELENRVHVLSHHLSLPKTYTDMIGMEKFLHFQNSVPCKVRAKRGCATHPRSIAERVRRTRISERMRKLQDLIPNMDKQTNTTDMLDLAVEYIKDLQKEYKILSDNRTNCKCSCKQQKAVQNQIM